MVTFGATLKSNFLLLFFKVANLEPRTGTKHLDQLPTF